MNEWIRHLYSALCIAVHQKCFTIIWGGGVSPQPPPVCSIHLDDATAATVHNGASALTTHQLQVERREREIQWMGIIRRPWLTRACGGNLARTLGNTPTHSEKCHAIFNDHRESMSHKEVELGKVEGFWSALQLLHQVFECWAAISFAADEKRNQSAAPC